jgi:ribose/xylose/arabinose/galactoside ABC-type transport system permease subunit
LSLPQVLPVLILLLLLLLLLMLLLPRQLRIGCRPLQSGSTNNEAEYSGMIAGLMVRRPDNTPSDQES